VQVPPEPILKVIGLFNPQLREVNEMLYQFKIPHIVDDSKFESRFGKKSTPLDQAIKTTVDWYREYAGERKK
jgi:hypothetical protein